MTKTQYTFTPILTRGVSGFKSESQKYETIYSTKFAIEGNLIICLCYDFYIGNRSFTFIPNLARRDKSDSFFKQSLFADSIARSSNNYIQNNTLFTDLNIGYTGITNNFLGNFYNILKPELIKRINYINEDTGNLIYTPNYFDIINHLKEMEKAGNLYAISEHAKNDQLKSIDLKIKYHIYYLTQIPTYVEYNYLHTRDNY